MASLASLNPFADLAGDTKKNKGKKQQSMHEMNNNKNNINNNYNNTNNINNNPFGLGLGNDDTFGNVTTNNANKNMHIDHLADFDPLASPPKKKQRIILTIILIIIIQRRRRRRYLQQIQQLMIIIIIMNWKKHIHVKMIFKNYQC